MKYTETRPPIFIIGNPRSGTTLLRLLLHNHGNIVIPPECGFAVWWYDKYNNWNEDSTRDRQLLDEFLQDLSTSRKIETWQMDFAALRDYIQEEGPTNYAELIACIYLFFGRSTGKMFRRWGDKNNFHVRWIERLSALFPNASYIHIVRDGRDVACSYRALSGMHLRSAYAPTLPIDIVSIAAEWTNNVEMSRASFSAIGWERVCEVRYEDLVTRTDVELMRICQFLDEPYDERMLRYHWHNEHEHQEPPEFLSWKQKTLEKPTTSEIGKYQHELTEEEIGLFEQHAGPLLQQYGYLETTR